jgi:hypothetical protein
MNKFIKSNWLVVLIAVFGISICWPLLQGGYFSHQDDLQVMRIFEMRKCFSDFQIPCRWVPDMGWGNGFPLFNFYGVFTYYLGGLLSYLVGYINASKLLFAFALLGGSFGIYLLVKEIWGKYSGLAASVLYLFAPYKALDIYVRGALAEAVALSLVPFVLYLGYKAVTKDVNFYKYFTLSLFFLFITHNIMTIIFIPVVFLWMFYWLFLNKFKDLKIAIFSISIAIGLSAFFLLPAFFEKNLIQTESLTRFELDYRANFISVRQLFLDRVWGYGTSIPGPEGGMNFQIGWPHWILAFIAFVLVFFFKTEKNKRLLVGSTFVLFVVSIFMTHNKSSFIWESFPILSFFQFPWRFLSLAILTSSILGGFVVSAVKDKYKMYLSLLIVTLTVLLNWSYFKPREFYDVNDSQKLSGQLWEDQRKGAVLDYLPKTALEPREGAPTQPQIISENGTVENYINKTNRFSFTAKITEKSRIEIPVYYFPNWTVFVNNKEYPLSYKNLLGRISIELEPGEYNVSGKFKNTPLRTFGNFVTFGSIVAYVILWKKRIKQ